MGLYKNISLKKNKLKTVNLVKLESFSKDSYKTIRKIVIEKMTRSEKWWKIVVNFANEVLEMKEKEDREREMMVI